jgi:single-strand DNA-binding protein
MGRLGADPVQVETQTGVLMARFPVATSIRYKDREETQWHQIVSWGVNAENCSRYLSKGSSVLVEGMMKSRKYEKDGDTRYRFEVHAERVQFLGGGKRKEQEGQPERVQDETMPVASAPVASANDVADAKAQVSV